MLTQNQIEIELNNRNYFLATKTPSLAPSENQTELPPEQSFFDKYGSAILVGAGVLFLIAMYPGQAEGGA